ncbi:inner membrane protein YpjD [Rheinheimera marina]|uniref:Inner membrane protein YpjD n=1 Tax=Rheinheimera marina TaxID=1774958 RepID=A0ABV9JM26_9GAMM
MSFVLFPSLALLAYLGATLLVLSRLVNPKGLNYKLVFGLAVLAIGCQGVFLAESIFAGGGQNFSLLNVISLVCWLIVIVITLSALRTPAVLLLPIVYGFAALNQLAILVLPSALKVQHFEQTPALLMHIIVAFVAYALLIVATLHSVQVSYISHKLKQKDFLLGNQFLPPLLQVESLQFRLLLAGTLLLGLTLLSGALFSEQWFELQHLHKNVLSSLAFLVFVVLLWGHARLGWRGRIAIALTFTGSTLLTLSYFGSRFVREILLHRLS